MSLEGYGGAAIVGVVALVILKEVFAFVKFFVAHKKRPNENGYECTFDPSEISSCSMRDGITQNQVNHIDEILSARDGGEKLVYGVALKKPLYDVLNEQKETTRAVKGLTEEIRLSRQNRQ